MRIYSILVNLVILIILTKIFFFIFHIRRYQIFLSIYKHVISVLCVYISSDLHLFQFQCPIILKFCMYIFLNNLEKSNKIKRNFVLYSITKELHIYKLNEMFNSLF